MKAGKPDGHECRICFDTRRYCCCGWDHQELVDERKVDRVLDSKFKEQRRINARGENKKGLKKRYEKIDVTKSMSATRKNKKKELQCVQVLQACCLGDEAAGCGPRA